MPMEEDLSEHVIQPHNDTFDKASREIEERDHLPCFIHSECINFPPAHHLPPHCATNASASCLTLDA